MGHREVLQNVPLFADLSSRRLAGLARACAEHHYKAGEALVGRGEAVPGLMVITAGSVRVVTENGSGGERPGDTHGPGYIIGETAVLDGAAATADVVAEEETICLVLAHWAFNAFLVSHPSAAVEVLPGVVRRLREACGGIDFPPATGSGERTTEGESS